VNTTLKLNEKEVLFMTWTGLNNGKVKNLLFLSIFLTTVCFLTPRLAQGRETVNEQGQTTPFDPLTSLCVPKPLLPLPKILVHPEHLKERDDSCKIEKKFPRFIEWIDLYIAKR
jgi:hypothetical protein